MASDSAQPGPDERADPALTPAPPGPDERADPALTPASPELVREVAALPDGRRLTLYSHRRAARRVPGR